MADLRAVISASIPPCPPEAQRPSKRDVSSAMAAGIACVGSLVELPPCYITGQLLILDGGHASSYDHGVQAGTGEARGANEVLGRLEEALEVGLVAESRTIRLG
jgi:hypothetical protein